MQPLKAPFVFFGGKSRVAAEVWRRFGNVKNFVEPFAGSLAVLLARPGKPGTETVNDLDGFITNFWRAVRLAPEETAQWADYPVSELDLHARHKWLIDRRGSLETMLREDPHAYDAKIAGWWVWGACAWIGYSWCVHPSNQLPHLDRGRGINRKLSGDMSRSIYIRDTFEALSERLGNVRIACGDWTRVCGYSVTTKHGLTGIFLDPPYGEGAMDYSAGDNQTDLAQDVAEWAASEGDNPKMRIAFCGYEGSVEMPDTWTPYRWKNRGGYGSQGNGQGRLNASRECIWFSPHCLNPAPTLFQPAHFHAVETLVDN